jgi:two-component system response regulator AtoC
MSGLKVFIVEDNKWYGEILSHHLSLNPDFEIHLFEDAASCISNLNLKPDVITIDFTLPDMNGEELLEKIKQINPTLPIIFISAQENIATAVNLIKKGVSNYIVKDDHTKDLLWNELLKIQELNNLKDKVDSLESKLETNYNLKDTIIGESKSTKRTHELIEKAINSSINVFITGETGTGKELVAKAIHYNGKLSKKPFIAINMAAIPRDLVESELFGHEKGSFTGATTRKKGKFEEANGGTLFLDEIAELDFNVQSKLLRVLQEREFNRIGSNEMIKLNIHLIVATNKDIVKEVRDGNFREDLYYRMIGLPINLPPLRERENDILILTKHFLNEYNTKNKKNKKILTEKAKQKLIHYNYPGNIRELKSIIDLACIMSDTNEIKEEDITFSSLNNKDLLSTADLTLREYTNNIIQYTLNNTNKNVIETAKKLDIGKSKIYNLINSGDIKV